jgi:hypothetical protein
MGTHVTRMRPCCWTTDHDHHHHHHHHHHQLYTLPELQEQTAFNACDSGELPTGWPVPELHKIGVMIKNMIIYQETSLVTKHTHTTTTHPIFTPGL